MFECNKKQLSPDIAEQVESTKALLLEHYLVDSRPWILAYSGGKDSTLVLQLVYEMLLELGAKARKPVYVLSSDTLVETPRIERHLRTTLDAVANDAEKRAFALTCEVVIPQPEETFWAKLIGKGYPPPTRTFRWCTSSMKIRPARRYIEDVVALHGSVVLLLGTRLSESSGRQQRMKARSLNSRGLNPHGEIHNAFVMTPIAEWEIEDVWEYLLNGPEPPWGGDHGNLAELYRDASGGECPLVLDLTTPSCGGSRFGCWTCTVVRQDRSLQGFIDSGDDSMLPLMHYCQWLREIREDESRRLKRRRDGSSGLGPFDPRTRKELLTRLLDTEQILGHELISDEVIIYIQSIWSQEMDLSRSAFSIALSFGRRINDERSSMPLSQEKIEILAMAAEKESVSLELLEKLMLLTEEIPDLALWGAKSQIRNRITEIIYAAAGEQEQGACE